MKAPTDYVPLPELVGAGAFKGKTNRGREWNTQRWCERLSDTLRHKMDGRCHVSPNARVPSGLTVEALLTTGNKPERLGRHRVPPGAVRRWTPKQRQRFLDTYALLERFDSLRAAHPTLAVGSRA